MLRLMYEPLIELSPCLLPPEREHEHDGGAHERALVDERAVHVVWRVGVGAGAEGAFDCFRLSDEVVWLRMLPRKWETGRMVRSW